ncbi:hypothetical protein BKA66DRAFT_549296 [Pyrenochaeta sp. MPI-SDFR-AT-0127]|nr:hypothetical protein BKA66DRAFT_549296 [Pyrenochaeta sp. MPI-SDFR-AT-0127]
MIFLYKFNLSRFYLVKSSCRVLIVSIPTIKPRLLRISFNPFWATGSSPDSTYGSSDISKPFEKAVQYDQETQDVALPYSIANSYTCVSMLSKQFSPTAQSFCESSPSGYMEGLLGITPGNFQIYPHIGRPYIGEGFDESWSGHRKIQQTHLEHVNEQAESPTTQEDIRSLELAPRNQATTPTTSSR